MKSARQSIDSIFLEAAELHSVEERCKYLDRVCGDDPELRKRVESLLRAQSKVDGFLESPAPELGAKFDPQITEQPGTVIGRYKLMEQIGDGGMGVVYVAQQTDPVRRKVALKIIKPGMDSKQVISRFEAERQALALMDHPHIAHVYDGGTTESGRPYFVMELVRGVPITEFCDSHQYTTQQRLHLFVDVCQAVQHAHQKGIIHRDVKPSNVLVTLHDHKPVVKVIDFGVAKAVNQELVRQTIYTNFAQMIGTPLYMSPEQAEMNALDVDTRSDIYSLGVVLYELLTGATPFDPDVVHRAGFDEMRRIIREVDPPRPSQRLTTLEGQALSTVSERRGVDDRQLGRILRGELDWIVMKALEKDRSRRYETASAMSADIDHFLKDEPVLACPPSVGYRFAKFVRRNKVAMTTASLVTLSLIAGIVGTTSQASRVKQEQQRTAAKAAESQAVVDFLVNDLLAAADPERSKGRSLSVTDVLANAESKIEESFQDQPPIEASVRMAMGSAYQALGEYDAAVRHFARAVELRARVFGPEDSQSLRSKDQLARVLTAKGKYIEAEKLLREVLETRRRICGPENRDTLDSKNHLADNLGHQDRYGEAEKLFREVLQSNVEHFGPEHSRTLASMDNLAQALLFQERFSDAEALFREVLEAKRRIYGLAHPSTIHSMHLWALWLNNNGRHTEAEDLYREIIEAKRRIYGTAHPSTLQAMQNLANALDDVGKWAECERLRREVAEARRSALGSEHPKTLASMSLLGTALNWQGKHTEAEQLYSELLEIHRRLLGAEDPETIKAVADLAASLRGQGRFSEAEELQRETLEACRRILGSDHCSTLETLNELAWTLILLGKFEEARHLSEDALTGQRRVVGAEHKETLSTQDTLARALEGLGQLAEARQLREEILKLISRDDASNTHKRANLVEARRGLALNIALANDASPNDRKRAIQLAEAAIELDADDGESWRILGIACAANYQWEKSLLAFERAAELGCQEQLVSSSMLLRIHQSDHVDDGVYRKLLNLLKAHDGQ